jgi:hypothetical protein
MNQQDLFLGLMMIDVCWETLPKSGIWMDLGSILLRFKGTP